MPLCEQEHVRGILGSKGDAVHSRHMILKMLQVVENESFRLANRMATGYSLARWDTL